MATRIRRAGKNPFSNQARRGGWRKWFFELGIFERLSRTAEDIGAVEKIRFFYFPANSEQDIEVGIRICLSKVGEADSAH